MKTILLLLALLAGGSAVASTVPTASSYSISSVGDHIRVGTGRVTVQARLGTPYASLADGTWLYRGFNLPDSTGGAFTLVVKFDGNRVSSLALATEAGEAAVRTAAQKAARPRNVALEGQR